MNSDTQNPLKDYRAQEIRLLLLKLLDQQPGRQYNSTALHAGLLYMGFIVERHEVIEALMFLQLHQLLELEHQAAISPDYYRARLLRRGVDVVRGHLRVKGVLDVVDGP